MNFYDLYFKDGGGLENAVNRILGTEFGDLKSAFMKGVFCPASPILANHNKNSRNANAFSCYITKTGDTLESINKNLSAAFLLTAFGGGIGCDWSDIRGTGKEIKGKGKSGGSIPFIKAQSTLVQSVSQAGMRRGSVCAYQYVGNPDILEFINMKDIRGGDDSRKDKEVHLGVIIDDKFIEGLRGDPHKNQILQAILSNRHAHGEPFIFFKDRCPSYHIPNLCTEVILPTKVDTLSVCCLGSFNFLKLNEEFPDLKAPKFHEFLGRIYDFMYSVFDDNIKKVKKMSGLKANVQEHIGLGVFGYADWAAATGEDDLNSPTFAPKLYQLFDEINSHPNKKANRYSTAIAPTETIARIWGASPALDPYPSKKFNLKDISGSRTIVSDHPITAYDQNQKTKILRYADLQKRVDQGISLTLYYKNQDPNQVASDFFEAWRAGIKTLYYTRSTPEVDPRLNFCGGCS